MVKPILNIAAYKFAPLDNLAALRAQLRASCERLALRGTILLAPEGINLFLAGAAEAVEMLLVELRAIAGLEALEVKRSASDTQPFGRMLVKLKKEIIPLGRPDIDPARHPAPRVAPRDLKRWLDAGRDDAGREVVLLDTRNVFEVEHGTFEGAQHIGLANFRSFAERVGEVDPALRGKTVVTFCTGGIRCEKAAPLLIHAGFPTVYQLDGGILKYFEECGQSHFAGNCYVFDERIALDSELSPSE